MEDIVIKIPEELNFVKQVPKIDWSILVSRLIKSKIDKITRMKKIVSKSQLTEKDIEDLSERINASLSQKYL